MIAHMLWRRRFDAFVSYSHKDEGLVKPMVEMLSLNDRKVFWDRKLQPGERWDDVIRSSVKRSSVFVLFWCCDTHLSEYTAKEIALALRLKKKIVPVKLCHAAMPKPLTDWQWIDLQKRVQHECGTSDHSLARASLVENAVAAPVFRMKFAMATIICTVAVMLSSALLFMRTGSKSSEVSSSIATPVASPEDNVRFRIPRGAILMRDGYVLIERPSGVRPGRIREFNARGGEVSSYAIPALPPAPKWPQPIEMALPSWYVNRDALFWALGSFALAVIIIPYVQKRRRRTEKTITLAIDYFRKLEPDR